MSSTTFQTTKTTLAVASNTGDAPEGHVHFDDSCVLIPDPVSQSRIPRIVKKSYSLPLWRRRSGSQQPTSDGEPDSAIAASPPKDGAMTITVPIPSFARSRSPTRSEPQLQPLVSCMVHENHHRHVRRPSLPLPLRPDAVVVPLRPCCPECYPITEECLREGDEWQEKFTRGARRRRNSSADAFQYQHLQRHRTIREDLPGFGAVVSVDEIDRRHGISRTAASSSAAHHDEDEEDESPLAPSLSRSRNLGTLLVPPAAIGEEDEEDSSNSSPSLDTPDEPVITPVPSGALADTCEFCQHLDIHDTKLEGKVAAVPNRETIYYTPDSSPMLESDEPLLVRDSPPPSFTPKANVLVTESPNLTTPTHSYTPAISIPDTSDHHHHHKAWFSDFTLATLDLLHESDHHQNRSSHYSTSTASPELSDYVPTLASSTPRKKNFLHSLPSPSSFLRVGSDVLKGIAAPGTVSGTFV